MSSLPSTTRYDAEKADRVTKRRAEMQRQMELMEEAANVSIMDAMADTGLNPNEEYDGSKRDLNGASSGNGDRGGGGGGGRSRGSAGGRGGRGSGGGDIRPNSREASAAAGALPSHDDPDKAERAAKRRAEMQRQMELMEEAANVSLMDVMANTGLNPNEVYDGSKRALNGAQQQKPPESHHRPSSSVELEDENSSHHTNNTEASSTNGADDLSAPPLSHEQIRENARRFLDDNEDSASFQPASSKGMAGINGPSASGKGGMGARQGSASVLERAKEFLFDGSPPGSASNSSRSVQSRSRSMAVNAVNSTRSAPGLSFGGTLSSSIAPMSSARWSNSPDKSTSPDRRRVYSTRKYGESMRDSMKNLFSQVQTRLQQQEAKMRDQDSSKRTNRKNGGGGGGGGKLVGISLWSRGDSGGNKFSDDSDSAEDNLAPRGGVMGTLRNINLGNRGGHDSSGRDLAYDPDNDEESCLERMRYACWEGCARMKYTCKNRSSLMLFLMMVLIAGSVAAIFVAVYDGEQQLVAAERGDDSGNEDSGAGVGAAGVAQDMINDAFGSDLEELPEITDVASGLRFGRIKERLIALGISDDNVLSYSKDSGVAPSAQYRALMWISEEDPLELDVEDDFLPQRYALAVFWFSTYETPSVDENAEEGALNEWADRTNWMTSKGLCSWYGVSCHHRPGTNPTEIKYDGNNGVTALNLTDNDVAGFIPPELFRALAADLRHLDLSDNYITGTLPPGEVLGQLTNLESLYLWGNDIEGGIPTQIGQLSKLRTIYLHDNLFEGPIPTELGSLTDVYNLGLYTNYLTGSIPTELGQLDKVRELYLDSNDLSGSLPSELFRLGNLVDLRLRDNALTGAWPSDPEVLGGLADLELLYADGNEFVGPVPPGLGSLTRLTELRLERNSFTGVPPPEWASLVDLVELRLEGNDLTGSVPSEWGTGMVDLAVLDMAGNGLGGTIPTELGQLVELRELKLNDNGGIGGAVPIELGDAFNLEIVHLHNNKLEGGLPGAIGNLNHLESLKVHGNAISGAVPPEVCGLTESDSLDELTADCGGDSPLVECECCSECFEHAASPPSGEAAGTRRQ